MFITPHAAFEIQRRGIAEEDVQQVLHAPEQRSPMRAGRDILQRRTTLLGKQCLL